MVCATWELQRRIRAAAPQQGAAARITRGACDLHRSGGDGMECSDVIHLRDGCHTLSAEQAAAFQLPVLMPLRQHRPHQANNRGVVGEDDEDTGASFDETVCPENLSMRR